MAKANKKEEMALEKKEAPGELQVYDYGDDAGSGFEGQTPDHLAIPFIAVLQKGSPQVENDSPPGAKSGNLFNTVTEELYDEVFFVPAYKEHVFVEWVPRTKGGGFVDVHLPSSDVVKDAKKAARDANADFGKYVSPDGNDLVETFYVYGALTDEKAEPNGEFAVLAFSSTKIKKYKKWNTAISACQVPAPGGRKQRPPLFAHHVKLTTVREENPKGSFHNFTLGPAGVDEADRPSVKASLLRPGHPAMDAAKSLADMVKDGLARASYDTQSKASGDGGEDGEKAPF